MSAQSDDQPDLFDSEPTELFKADKSHDFKMNDKAEYRSLNGLASVLLVSIDVSEATFMTRRDRETGGLLASPDSFTIGRREWVVIAPSVQGRLSQCFNKEQCRLEVQVAPPSATAP